MRRSGRFFYCRYVMEGVPAGGGRGEIRMISGKSLRSISFFAELRYNEAKIVKTGGRISVCFPQDILFGSAVSL